MSNIIRSGSVLMSANLIKKFADRSEEKAELARRKIAMLLFAEVIVRSPVDTGRFRANWFTTVTRPSIQVAKSVGRNVMGKMEERIETAKDGASFFLTNNLPYSQAIENGHSGQAPAGVVRLAMRKIPHFVARAVRELG